MGKRSSEWRGRRRVDKLFDGGVYICVIWLLGLADCERGPAPDHAAPSASPTSTQPAMPQKMISPSVSLNARSPGRSSYSCLTVTSQALQIVFRQ